MQEIKPRLRKEKFESPRLVIFGTIQDLTRSSCPTHGSANEPGGPFTDGPTFTGCGTDKGQGSKKT